MKKLSEDELTRLAFVWAEQDRSSLADCWPVGTAERAKALSEYKQLHEYRTKKWGATKMETLLKGAKRKSILR